MTINYINPPNYWISDHELSASETPDTGDISVYDIAIKTETGEVLMCLDNTPDSLIWSQVRTLLYQGTAALVLGAATIELTELIDTQKITLDYVKPDGVPGAIFLLSVNPGTGFVVNSTSMLDTGLIAWSVYA
jgi:hypothetical protein